MASSEKPKKIYYAWAEPGEEEKAAVMQALDDKRLGPGKYCREFEDKVSTVFEKRYGISVNSGSSANMIALSMFGFPKGSEVITPATTFATTVAPIIQQGLIPVFVDVHLGSNLIKFSEIEAAISDKTVAIMVPELIGNLVDMQELRRIADAHNLYIIDDSCDTIGGKIHGHSTGYWSDVTTTSFFASHIITAGGMGGMVSVNKIWQKERGHVFRDWGRVGDDSEAFEKRFNFALDGIPYDVKFAYAELGYNMKMNEMAAAYGLAQLKKLEGFAKKRRDNFDSLYKFFSDYEEFFILPKEHPKAEVNWLAFPLTLRDNSVFKRYDILKYLEENEIQTRVLFSGNALRHPAMRNVAHRRASKFENGDKIMEDGFLVGCHAYVEKEDLARMKEVFATFLKNYRGGSKQVRKEAPSEILTDDVEGYFH